jgi:hypothetical protein
MSAWEPLYVVAARLETSVADVEDALRTRGYDLDADARTVDGEREYRSAAVAVALARPPWIDKHDTAKLIGCSVSSVRPICRVLADEDRRVVKLSAHGGPTRRAEYRRTAVERLVADRARAAAEREQDRAERREERKRLAAERQRARRAGQKLSPMQLRVAAIVARTDERGDAGRRVNHLIGARLVEPGTPGAVQLSASTWVVTP